MRVMNFVALASAKKFEELCQALLQEEYPRFQPFSAPDWGMDGYDSDSKTIFQAYFPERSPRKDKIHNDLAQAKEHGERCCHWVLLLPKNPSAALLHWLETEEKPCCQFTIEVWGHTKISALLQKRPSVREEFFPTEWRKELRRVAKGQKPRLGDAEPGSEIPAEASAELSQLIKSMAEETAARKRRSPRNSDYAREYGEFNAHFQLSAYDRLPSAKLPEARVYLERKLYGRRRADTVRTERHRYISGIKAIQAKLEIDNEKYRRILIGLTGKSSTTTMEVGELSRVFRHFKQMQGLAQLETSVDQP